MKRTSNLVDIHMGMVKCVREGLLLSALILQAIEVLKQYLAEYVEKEK